jgi:murein DD-endopeptidase MepM/ murein hydrolase activator NlpD
LKVKLYTRIALAAGLLAAAFLLIPENKSVDIRPIDAPDMTVGPKLFEAQYSLKRNETLFSALLKIGFTGQEINAMVDAAKPLRDMARLPLGLKFSSFSPEPTTLKAQELRFYFSPTEHLKLALDAAGIWKATLIDRPVSSQITTFQGIVKDSLWASADEAGMDPELISNLTEIFAWSVDFSREVQPGDSWRLSVEKKSVEGEKFGWGKILAAEYKRGGETYTAVLFSKNGEDLGYFAPDGKSLRKMFLRAPMKFGRITSRFTHRRFHPILKRHRPHLGVDYGAPTGTPVLSVGDGAVMSAGWEGGGGKTLKIRHNSTYTTVYRHLNGFARGVARGARVKQGQVVAYVGTTGLSTGPHLHFEFWENGRYIDPLGKKFPTAEPVAKTDIALFEQAKLERLALLPAWGLPYEKNKSQARLDEGT